MYYNVALGDAKIFYFLLKKLFNEGTRMRWGYPNPSGTGMRFNFSSPLGMGRVTSKYMRIEYGDGEDKTCPHPAPLLCLFTVQLKRKNCVKKLEIKKENRVSILVFNLKF